MNTDGSKPGTSHLPTSKLLRGCIILTIILVAVFPLFALVGHWLYGSAGIMAAGVAGTICLVAAVISLFALVAIPGVSGILLAMLLRMAIPMATGLLISAQKGILAEVNVLGFILAYYLIMLVAETKLSLGFVQGQASSSPPSSKAS